MLNYSSKTFLTHGLIWAGICHIYLGEMCFTGSLIPVTVADTVLGVPSSFADILVPL